MLYNRIRERREALDMSQADLAAALGYANRSTIAKIEKGVNDITQSKIAAFADALHTTPAYLMGWTDDWYDYDRDEDNRLSDIPPSQLDGLIEYCDGDLSDVWREWNKMQDDTYEYAVRELSQARIEPSPTLANLVPVIFAYRVLNRGFPLYFEMEEAKLLILNDTDGAFPKAKYAIMVEFTDTENRRFVRGDVLLFDDSDRLPVGELGLVLDIHEMGNGFSERDYWFVEGQDSGYLPVGVGQSEIERQQSMADIVSGETYVSVMGKFLGVLDKSKIVKGTLDF